MPFDFLKKPGQLSCSMSHYSIFVCLLSCTVLLSPHPHISCKQEVSSQGLVSLRFNLFCRNTSKEALLFMASHLRRHITSSFPVFSNAKIDRSLGLWHALLFCSFPSFCVSQLLGVPFTVGSLIKIFRVQLSRATSAMPRSLIMPHASGSFTLCAPLARGLCSHGPFLHLVSVYTHNACVCLHLDVIFRARTPF